MPPHILDRVEFRRVHRQSFDNEATLSGGDVVLDQQAPMNRRAIPDQQDLAGKVPLKMAEERDGLEAFDAACMNLEIELPESQAAYDRKAFPVERLVQHQSLPTGCPSPDSCRTGAQAAFVNKNDGAALLSGPFLKLATPPVAISGWPSRRVPPPDVPVAGN